MNKFWKNWNVLLWVAFACFAVISIVWATEDMGSRPYKFDGTITHNNNMTRTGTLTQTGAATVTGAVTITGDVAITGGLSVSDEIIVPPYEYASTAGALTWTTAYGHVVICSGSTESSIALPTITSAMSGYIFTVKNQSGATTRTLTPTAGVDAIESTRGTITGTSDTTIDAAGDVGTWMALYRSGASPYWVYIHKELT